MKKILLVIHLLLLGFIYACNNSQEETPYIIPAKSLSDVRDVEVFVFSEIYGYFPDKMPIYYFDENPLPYLDIEMYIAILDSLDSDLKLSTEIIESKIIITHEHMYNFEYEFNYQAELDANINEIYVDGAFFSQIDFALKTTYNHITITDYTRDATEGYSINLNDYAFTIEQTDGKIYMPFHLAVLVFNPMLLHTHYNYDTVYFGYWNDGTEFPSTYLRNFEVPIEILESTYQYMRLFFDYFYGLSQFKEITGEMLIAPFYEDLMDPKTHYQTLRHLLTHLDDLHTSIINSNLYLDDTDYTASTPEYINQSRRTVRLEAIDNIRSYCNNRRTGWEKIDNDTAMIHIKSFTRDTGTVIKRYLDQINEDSIITHVILDLSCSPGGSGIGWLETLSMMTNESTVLRRLNTIDGSVINLTFNTNYQINDELNWFILVSPYSYSGANLVASIASDNNLAKIIGMPSTGGASTISRTTTPSGQSFYFSSFNHYVGNNLQTFEFGINPDIYIEINDFSNIELILSLIKE
ncbi:MAG: S41 family peptidase [Candidatus Izemoplasmataceae bacterium]